MMFVFATSIAVALPSVQRDLNSSATADDWILTIFLLTSAVAIAAGGRAADIYGRRRVFLMGMGLFVVSSALCGVAVTDWWLIVARGLQGVGAALVLPAGIALVTTNFPAGERGRSLGWMYAVGLSVLGTGPILAGLITEELSWRWMFLIAVLLGVAIMVVVRAAAVESRDDRDPSLDVTGLLILGAALTALVLGLSQGPEWGFDSPRTLVLLFGSLLLLVAFGVVESGARDPLIPLGLLRHPRVLAAGALGFASNFVIVGFFVFGLLYCEKGLGFSPLVAALLFLAVTIPQLVVSPAVGQLAGRVGPTALTGAGTVLMVAALAWFSGVVDHAGPLALIPPLVLFGLSIALLTTPARLAAQTAAPREYQGMVAGVTSTLARLGSMLGVVVVGSVLLALQYADATDLLNRAGLRLGRNENAALDSVLVHGRTGRTELHELPSVLGGALRNAAHDALTYAFANSMRITAGVAIVAGVIAVVLFRSSAASGPTLDPEAVDPLDAAPVDPLTPPNTWR